jgi:hypothetical protein
MPAARVTTPCDMRGSDLIYHAAASAAWQRGASSLALCRPCCNPCRGGEKEETRTVSVSNHSQEAKRQYNKSGTWWLGYAGRFCDREPFALRRGRETGNEKQQWKVLAYQNYDLQGRICFPFGVLCPHCGLGIALLSLCAGCSSSLCLEVLCSSA